MKVSARHMLARGLVAICLLGWGGAFVPARTLTLNHHLASTAAPASEEGKGEGRELIYKIINFSLLVGALAFLLRKPLAAFFAQCSEAIRKGLEDGRKALADSQAQLRNVEERLRHLEEEIAAFKSSAAQEMEVERQRLKQAAAEEAEKILQAARAQTETSVRAARLDLKNFAASQAVALAEEIIRGRLDDAGRKKLVAEFVAKVGGAGS